jgi:hypothetical protein
MIPSPIVNSATSEPVYGAADFADVGIDLREPGIHLLIRSLEAVLDFFTEPSRRGSVHVSLGVVRTRGALI